MKTFHFHWLDASLLETGTDQEKYQCIVQWAQKARSVNPDVFDALTRWLLESEGWSSQEFEKNKNLLLNDIFGKFLTQNALLREVLASLKPSGIVNPPVFEALDRFDDKLHGNTNTDALREAVTSVFQILQPCAFEKPENFLREAKPGISGPIGCSLMAI